MKKEDWFERDWINHQLSRRGFIKWSACLGAGTAFVGLAGLSGCAPTVKQAATVKTDDPVSMVPFGCAHNCGGKCLMYAHVKDGTITRITSDVEEPDVPENPQLRACLRGRSYRKRVYDPSRLKYPMKRVGERGEGKFVRISWEEAIDGIAKELTRIKNTHGPSSVFNYTLSGNTGAFHGTGGSVSKRFFSVYGGFVERLGSYSSSGTQYATPFTYGTNNTGNHRRLFLQSKLIILLGNNPAETIFGTNTAWYLKQAREKGARVICIDPQYSMTAVMSDEWVGIRPGTDAALLAAMAYVMISENLYDREFVEKFTVGFNEFQTYILGQEDGVAKTPAWAEAICGVPAAKITELGRLYGTSKPAALFSGWGPQRNATCVQDVRMATVLAAMSGNVGIAGGYASGTGSVPSTTPMGSMPILPCSGRVGVPVYLSTDMILKGKAGGYPADVKALYIVGGNMLTQHPDAAKTIKAFKAVELLVVHEQFMTPTAKYADYLLPVSTFLEKNDILMPWSWGDYAIYSHQAIEPMFEAKSDYEIFSMLADRMGFKQQYTENKSEEDWLKTIFAKSKIPNYEEFKKRGYHKFKVDNPYIAFKEQIESGKPFPTPSGKIEIYSERLAKMNNPQLPPIPKYVPLWEGVEDPLQEKYPLQLITPHFYRRVHSTHDNNPWLQEVEPQAVWINTADAKRRGIAHGDRVKVWNDRGIITLPAKVTPRIVPGVIAVFQGAWYNPDANGVDAAGSANTLTSDRAVPGAKSSTSHTSLVQIAKA
jgi:anaerobic dimethyl sulfoxide reductase subunit A